MIMHIKAGDYMKNIQVRVNSHIKDKSDEIFEALGTTTNEAIKIFLSAAINEKGFPFKVKLPKNNTLEEYVNDHMLPLSDKEIDEGYFLVEGSFSKSTEFSQGVYLENVKIKGFLFEEQEDSITVAEAKIMTINGSREHIAEVADAFSGDTELVGSTMMYDSKIVEGYSKIAILDEFFVFSQYATAKTRVKLFAEYVLPYLADRDIEYVGFMNAGLWRTESAEERRAQTKALKELDIVTEKFSSENWAESVNIIEIVENL